MRFIRLFCAIGVSLWSAVVTGSQAPTGELSGALRAHVKNERLGTVTSIRGLPLGVRDGLQTLFGSQALDIAEPGAEFQVTDVVGNPKLPIRRLVAAGCSTDHCLVYYERGGIAHTWLVALFHWTPAATRFEWGGTAPGGLATIDDVRKAVAVRSDQKSEQALVVLERPRLHGTRGSADPPLAELASRAILDDMMATMASSKQPVRRSLAAFAADSVKQQLRRASPKRSTRRRGEGGSRERSERLAEADSHDLIRVQGARVNNLKDVSVEIPKRRLTVFTGVSGSGKSSLVFGTIAAESQRLINETYSAFVQGFMPTLDRPEVDLLEGLTTAIIVDQERMGANARSTVGTVTDANAMLRVLWSRLGKPHIGPPPAFSFNIPTRKASGAMTVDKGKGERVVVRDVVYHGGMCPRCEGMGSVSDIDLSQLFDDSKSINEGAIKVPGFTSDGWYVRITASSSTWTSRSANTARRSATTSSTRNRPR